MVAGRNNTLERTVPDPAIQDARRDRGRCVGGIGRGEEAAVGKTGADYLSCIAIR